MSVQEVPGYYYDKEKKRYFKILKHELPEFTSRSSVNTKIASEINARKLDLISGRIRSREHFNLLRSLNARERNACWSASDLCTLTDHLSAHCTDSDLIHARVKNLSPKLSDNSIGAGRALFSPDGRYLYILQPGPDQICILASYSTAYDRQSRAVRRAVFGGFRAKEVTKLSLNFLASNMAWVVPGRKIGLLGGSHWSPKAILHVLCVEGTAIPREADSIQLTFATSKSIQFATPYLSIEASENSRVPLYIYSRSEILRYRMGGGYSQLHLPIPRDCSTGKSSPVAVTACAHTTSTRKESIDASNGLFYVAATHQGALWLDLVEASRTQRRLSKFLIRFKLCQRHTDKSTDITFLQSLVTAGGDRFGLLVGRRSGLLQLWDDRWPAGPVLNYHGSATVESNRTLCEIASHQPLVPTVSPVDCNMVVSPLLASGHIGIWNLRTGEPINTIEIPSMNVRQASTPPPVLFFRPNWSDPGGLLSNGPTLMAFDQGTLHWFWEDGLSNGSFNVLPAP
ncbi:hypothetical protein T265_14689 [Opisthorchis viverrini]|uniref:Uncharacterized protein n=1 Tax=Opisthorchis viverrini TaxID=6198 RepID=A0A074Z7Z4_OPIVI|nr:hypothetical protein T265_14689 [Opisthorchis viverrini]KER23213.1 hypothetical protein T265_14689 [Opisthorchis viverrini]